ncbi:MAG TPA: IMP cyclohydrolase [Candidatus Brocadiia bacterium]|nr:IMP cyclohydrolase [Candidatus Brocadiia bacterium]
MAQDFKKAYRTIMDDHFPPEMRISFGETTLVYRKRTWKMADEKTGEMIEKGLRYGENPGQEAALYELVNGNLSLGGCEFIEPGRGLVSAISDEDMLQFGKHPGKTNLTDVDNALNILRYIPETPAAVIMKHNNPSGAARAATLADAYSRAYWADALAAFGGAVVVNRAMDKATAEQIAQSYVEVVAAPDYEAGTVEILAGRKNLRILRVPNMDRLASLATARFVDFKSLIDGGIIVQQSPLNAIRAFKDFLPATAKKGGKEIRAERQPTQQEMEDLLFGWQVEQAVSSNSVLYVKDNCTVAIGAGQQDRVGVAKIAVFKAYSKYADGVCRKEHGMSYDELCLAIERGERPAAQRQAIDEATRQAHGGLTGSVMVSDAFFPSRDGVDVGIREGVTAIVQPGGSLADAEVIEACNAAGVAMVFTGQRAFKH